MRARWHVGDGSFLSQTFPMSLTAAEAEAEAGRRDPTYAADYRNTADLVVLPTEGRRPHMTGEGYGLVTGRGRRAGRFCQRMHARLMA